MSEYTAIYEAGESLVDLLRKNLAPQPIAKPEHIGLCEPQEPEDYQLTVWIYGIEECKDTGTRTGYIIDPTDPTLERFAPLQVKLHLLVSAHSKASAMQKYADRYRIIGGAMQLIRDNPHIPAENLQGTLKDQNEPILMELVNLNAEEMSRIWNNSSKTMVPSFGVDITQVFIKSLRVRTTAPRVTSAQITTKQKKN